MTIKKPLIYWQLYDSPIETIDNITNRPITITGEWKCDHPKVERGWKTGGLSLVGDNRMVEYNNFLMKDGSRKEFTVNQHPETFEQEEKWLEQNGYNK